jgi:alkyldihydroxyacetonephosphate synthase
MPEDARTTADGDAAEMSWSGWGDPARAEPLPEPVVALLREALGVEPADAPPVALEAIGVPESGLTDAALDALAAIVSAGNVRTDAESRIRHTRGKSTSDLLRMRAGQAGDAPDAVVLPGTHDEVLAVLEVCSQRRITVVPFGGGTSVVGGLTPPGEDSGGIGGRPRIALDLCRLDRLVTIDPVSHTATFEAGLRAPLAEALLRERGFTLGHFPQSYEWATIGGFAAARSSGQASAGYGRFDEMVVGLTVATPQGTLALGRAPKSAAGPDLRQLVLGSEGAFGVITSVTVRLHPAPEATVYEGWRFGSFAEGTAALRRLAQRGPLPTVLRLSDEAETLVGLARPGDLGELAGPAGCLAIVGFEGSREDVASRRAEAGAVLAAAGGEPLGTAPGRSWADGRFSAPYLRDALLDAGAFAETLETAAFWSGIPALYDAVREALVRGPAGRPAGDPAPAAGPAPLVMCHISHVYPTGASLYFTVVSAQDADAVAHWARAKAVVCDAILAAGGTISHHHGVGTDHRDWYVREVGPLAVDVLRAIKDRLDPAGILNPGILLPASAPPAARPVTG